MRLFLSLFLLALPLAACFSALDPEAREAAKKRTQLTQTIESGTLANERLADAYVERGNAWLVSHEPESALEDYGRAIEAAPGLSGGYEARAQLLLSLRRYDPALADASKVVALGPPGELNGRLIRAAVLAATGRHDLASAEYDEVISRFGRSWQMLARRGAELAAIGQDDRAFADVDEAIPLGEREFPGLNDPGYSILVRPGVQADLVHLRALVDLQTALGVRGRIWLQRSRYEQALADLDRAGTFGDNLVYRGLAKLGLGRCSDGYDDLRHSTSDTQTDLKSTLAAHQAFIQQTKCAGYAP
jgi:tetratricopeptide (TPR) repeat protein